MAQNSIFDPGDTEDCKLVVICQMQNRNATDKLNPQCRKLALFANAIIEICGYRMTMLVYYIVDLAYQICLLQVTTHLQSSVSFRNNSHQSHTESVIT